VSEPLIDSQTFGELKQTVGGDFVAELVETFLEEAPPILAALRAAFDARAADAFRRAFAQDQRQHLWCVGARQPSTRTRAGRIAARSDHH
jgi:histidine phosphotransfer protein HptB